MIKNLKELAFGGGIVCYGINQDRTPAYIKVKMVNVEDSTVLLENGVICLSTQIEGVSLTPHWLLKFNACLNGNNMDFFYERFRLIWKEAYKYWYVIDRDTCAYLTKVEFVHEWQNFIFVMDGKELQITI